MAKKKEKKSSNKAAANPADALRDAVERTFQGAAGAMGGAAGAQKRVQDVFDDFAGALTRLRETVDEKRVLETLDHLREEVQGLARRVGDLERSDHSRATPAAAPATQTAKPKPKPKPRAAAPSASKATPGRRAKASTPRASSSKPPARKPATRRRPTAGS